MKAAIVPDVDDLRLRAEHFGGIIGINNPPALLFVDRQFMRELGVNDSPLWYENKGHLSAPTEVHFNVTGFCPLGCEHCTSDSGEFAGKDLTLDDIKRIIDVLDSMNVFHIAFGGGEFFSRPDAIEIAEYARSKGIIPNATTNGYYMTPELAAECRLFGQINVSLDGVGETYGIIRGVNIFDEADRAVKMLVKGGASVGINSVAARDNFDYLEEVVAYADRLRLNEVLFLRLKPSGRARNIYLNQRLTHEQNIEFFPRILALSKRYNVKIQVDCSFVPHICYHKPSKKVMATFGIEGCEGGNALLGVRHDGFLNACSHSNEFIKGITRLESVWNAHRHFGKFRNRNVRNSKCNRCGYSDICRGGCPLFSEFLEGDFNAPDPECPLLVSGI